jgi:excisionase family DNA binding protein
MLSVKDAAKRLGISASKLYQLVAARSIAFYRVGGKILFSDEDVTSFLAGCHVAPASRAPVMAVARAKLKHLNLR